MGSNDKPMDEQLQELWEEQGERIGVPQGVHDLLNSAPMHKSESAHERRNRLQREWRAKQRTKSAGPSETLQEQSNRLCRKRRTVQQATAPAQPSLGSDALQLFRDEDMLAPGQWDCGEMDTIYGFYNAKMWFKE